MKRLAATLLCVWCLVPFLSGCSGMPETAFYVEIDGKTFYQGMSEEALFALLGDDSFTQEEDLVSASSGEYEAALFFQLEGEAVKGITVDHASKIGFSASFLLEASDTYESVIEKLGPSPYSSDSGYLYYNYLYRDGEATLIEDIGELASGVDFITFSLHIEDDAITTLWLLLNTMP